MDQFGRVVVFNPPDSELMSGPTNPNENNDPLREEHLEEIEKVNAQSELIGREISFNPADAELMSGPLLPNEENDLLRDELLEEVERGETD